MVVSLNSNKEENKKEEAEEDALQFDLLSGLGLRFMVYKVYGVWFMVYGLWCMV